MRVSVFHLILRQIASPIRKLGIGLLLIALSTACSAGGGSRTTTDESTTPGGGPSPTPGVTKPKAKVVSVASGGRMRVAGSSGGRADLTFGPTTRQIEVKTSGGYQVYLSIAGEVASDNVEASSSGL